MRTVYDLSRGASKSLRGPDRVTILGNETVRIEISDECDGMLHALEPFFSVIVVALYALCERVVECGTVFLVLLF